MTTFKVNIKPTEVMITPQGLLPLDIVFFFSKLDCILTPDGYSFDKSELTAQVIEVLSEEKEIEVIKSPEVQEFINNFNPSVRLDNLKVIMDAVNYTPIFPLMQHQSEAVLTLLHRKAYGFFHAPGLGKTKTILEGFSILKLQEPDLKLFVVAPNFLVLNWKMEIEKHTPQHSIIILQGDGKKKLENITKEADIYLTNIESLAPYSKTIHYINRKGIPAIRKQKIDDFPKAVTKLLEKNKVMGVIDESTRIKTPTTKQTKFCLSIKDLFERRYILSGTPITRNILDIWSQLTFLDDFATGHNFFNNFKTQHCEMGGRYGEKLIRVKYEDLLYKNIAKWSEIKEKKDCADLPDKIFKHTVIKMEAKQRKTYDKFLKTCKAEIETISGEKITVERDHILAKAQILMQICKGFFFIEHLNPKTLKLEKIYHEVKSPKFDVLIELLKNEYENQQVIIWTTHVPERKLVAKRLQKEKIKFEMLEADTSPEVAQQYIANFQAKKLPVLVCSLQSFCEGITLTAADVEIFFSNSYRWDQREQAEDRTHRIGTVKSPLYHDLIMEDSIEELILKNLQEKGEFVEYFIEEVKKL